MHHDCIHEVALCCAVQYSACVLTHHVLAITAGRLHAYGSVRNRSQRSSYNVLAVVRMPIDPAYLASPSSSSGHSRALWLSPSAREQAHSLAARAVCSFRNRRHQSSVEERVRAYRTVWARTGASAGADLMILRLGRSACARKGTMIMMRMMQPARGMCNILSLTSGIAARVGNL